MWNSFGIFSADKSPDANNDHLLNLIIKCFRKLLVLRSIRSEMLDPKFISAFSTLMNTSRSPELSFNAAICLSHYSEDIRAHDQLNKLDVLKIFCRTLKESKQKKMHNQACRFLSNISWNPKYSHTLLNNNIVVNMLSLLENQNNFKLIKYCIFAIGNLSATPNFFSKCQNMSINPIINLLDYNSEDKETIMEYASFALANISLDQSTHAEILKEPEISIIHKNFVMGDNHKIIKNLMILVTNLGMNQRLNIKLLQKDFFKKAVDLMIDENAKYYKRYIAKSIASLSFLPEFQEYILQNDLMIRLLNSVYQNDDSTKETVFLSIFTMVKNMAELRVSFFNNSGTNMINYFLNKSTEVSADLNYIAVKFLVYLSETVEFQQHVLTIKEGMIAEFVKIIVSFASKTDLLIRNDFRCIHEGIRFLINLSLMRKETPINVVTGLCTMCKACVKSNNPNNVPLAFLGLKLVSQNHKHHEDILKEDHLFDYILRLDESIVKDNAKAIMIFCFNMLINEDCQKKLIQKDILRLIGKLVIFADEVGIAQIQAVITSLIKTGHIKELIKSKVEEIILNLLKNGTASILNSIDQTFYVVHVLTTAVLERKDQRVPGCRHHHRHDNEVPGEGGLHRQPRPSHPEESRKCGQKPAVQVIHPGVHHPERQHAEACGQPEHPALPHQRLQEALTRQQGQRVD